MKKVLLSVFACEPGSGSEEGNGWNWATGLIDEGYEVHCLTRLVNKEKIEAAVKPSSLHFHYVAMPLRLEFLFWHSIQGMYFYYIIWQWQAYRVGKKLARQHEFFVCHHISWGSLQMGSFLYKLNVPFVFGPAGGGQKAPEAFKAYFLDHWQSEVSREKISKLLTKYSPSCKNMLKKAHAVLVSNYDTLNLAKTAGAKNVYFELDTALPNSFFPENNTVKSPQKGVLNLLWVGRFMPRKGVLLTLDVMKELKGHENITLTIVGDGEMKDAIAAKVKNDGLENTVTLTGRVPFSEVRSFYASRDVFFFTSLRDSCPAQLVEAMAFGMPVVTLKLHGQEILVNEQTGIRCDCATPEMAIKNLKEAIIYLYNHPEKVSELSAAAYEFAKQQTWPNKIHKIVSKYYPAN